ncbi:MAG TPA: CDP-diacylglycerol--glycerol-3-phosphate 3-phosphatidyltransferase, partial [Alphaproteobacteria bacterium]|nr:CDP-diacylglycerol--glycerol-3-phosphate 3-phosphatidyltransferase [Alphaproteobacteria bacterium]
MVKSITKKGREKIKQSKEKIDLMLQKNLSNKVWTIPNILTIVRILSAPFLFFLFLTDRYFLGIILIVFAAITDLLDGYIARRYNMGSSIGQTLDPIADKIMIFTLIILSIIKFNFPIWLSIIIVSRDIMILLGGLLLIALNRNNRILLSPNIYGKISTFTQFTTIGIYLFAKISGLYAQHSTIIIILLYLTCIITVLSGLLYIIKGYKIFRENRLSKSGNKSFNHKLSGSKNKNFNIANLLTVSRIIFIIPFIILLEGNFPYREYIVASIFIALSLSDLLDGYVARKRSEVTSFGAMLDPLADKLLVITTLIFLIGQDSAVRAWMVCVIIARELLITALRS